MKKITLLLLLVLTSLMVQAQPDNPLETEADWMSWDIDLDDPLATHHEYDYVGTLETILERRYIRILTTPGDMEYFKDRDGSEAGFQYYLANEFVNYLNKKYKTGNNFQRKIKFEMIPLPKHLLIPMLVEGRGDIIASNLKEDDDRDGQVQFAKAYHKVDEIIYTGKDVKLRSVKNLAGQNVHVPLNSAEAYHLELFNDELFKQQLPPLEIIGKDPTLTYMESLGILSQKSNMIMVMDSHLQDAARLVYKGKVKAHPALKIATKVKLAWATHIDANDLNDEINIFFKNYKKGTLLGNINFKKYYQNRNNLTTVFLDDHNISKYDHLFKRYTRKYANDFVTEEIPWKLIAALVYKESKFSDRNMQTNAWGARGLFQIKDGTAKDMAYYDPSYRKIMNENEYEPEFDDWTTNVESNLRAGIKYLYWLKRHYFSRQQFPKMTERNRLRFMISAYNSGANKPLKAIRLAKKLQAKGRDIDPYSWFQNVEKVILRFKKYSSSRENVNYVSTINKLYLFYLRHGKSN